MLFLSLEAIKDHDLSAVLPRIKTPAARQDFLQPHANHYKLCSYLADLHCNSVMVDCGTAEGFSALALAAHAKERENQIISCDPIDTRQVSFLDLPITYFRKSCLASEIFPWLMAASVILLDISHDGETEWRLFRVLYEAHWPGVLVVDDIQGPGQLKKLWQLIPLRKWDLSYWCHRFNGTGLVDFSGRVRVLAELPPVNPQGVV